MTGFVIVWLHLAFISAGRL